MKSEYICSPLHATPIMLVTRVTLATLEATVWLCLCRLLEVFFIASIMFKPPYMKLTDKTRPQTIKNRWQKTKTIVATNGLNIDKIVALITTLKWIVITAMKKRTFWRFFDTSWSLVTLRKTYRIKLKADVKQGNEMLNRSWACQIRSFWCDS